MEKSETSNLLTIISLSEKKTIVNLPYDDYKYKKIYVLKDEIEKIINVPWYE